MIPVFNEAANLALLLRRLERSLAGADWEAVFVNDGSTDDSLSILRVAAHRDRRVKVIGFSRNFGHQAAITAGLDFAQGDAVAVMDADLQDPPELLPGMLELLRTGYDVVSPQRVSRAGETWFKRSTAGLFYRMLGWMLDGRLRHDVGDFRMFSRRAVLALREFREQHRFLRGLVPWLGLTEAVLPFNRSPRAGGATKYSFSKMSRLAWTAITSFSALPLRLATLAGAALSWGGFVWLVFLVCREFTAHAVSGWLFACGLQLMLSGVTLLALGVLGDYVARNYEESKARPLYVVGGLLNLAKPAHRIERAAILADAPLERMAHVLQRK